MNIAQQARTLAAKLRMTGTEDLQDQELIKRITTVNTLCITFSVALFLVLCTIAMPTRWESALMLPMVVELVLNNLVLVANHYRQYSLAAVWLFLLQCAAIMYFGNLLGSAVQLQFAVVYLIAVVYLVFPTRLERRFCIACAFIALLFLELNYYNAMPAVLEMDKNTTLLIHSVVIISVFGVLMVICRPYVMSNDVHTAIIKADHYKKVYLYQVTHDLKTPLHVMTIAASLIKQELKKKHPHKKVDDLLEQLQAAGISANTLVNNVLTMAEIEAGKMETPEAGTFIVREFFNNIVHVHKVISGTRNIKLKLQIDHRLPDLIISDSLKLNQIATNLLSNAIHYAYRNTTVEMEVVRVNDTMQIRVSNHGQGISQEVQEHLFNPFVTGGNKHRKGTGLGLYIVKTKVASMGGQIRVCSEPGAITTFTVTLPLLEGAHPEDMQALPAAKQNSELHHTHVLLAGPLQQPHGLLNLPETMGCRVSRASDGNEVLAMVSNDVPDVIIIDHHLAAIRAEEVLQRLKKNAVLKAIPVLVTSEEDNNEPSASLLAAGADGIIGDRFNYRQLYQALTPFLHTEENVSAFADVAAR
ncbi:hybrid sensor histidine kinase/response regulator [Pseudoflavitalea sp. G-6-1-2]|uniref:ATP-binding response regulator n=1 Tax=Pseudoflavitalea sp. G-6-1-2 TaxID=2728841 RepID=UPI00146B8FDB|nr:hybrid sensor histidine kinase/response regulator [Pseudoflavitalea sp. G-6-1-2]NML23778.1 hybrid sensor histidine kinase/response regulator [Pseudoflavitalea sp. G-6-1-2]